MKDKINAYIKDVKEIYLLSIYRLLRHAPLIDYLNIEKIGIILKVRFNTMVGYKRLSNVFELSQLIENNKTSGAFVECGVWKGGCVAIMAYVSKKARSNRKIWLFDSFEGLPEPTEKDGNKAKEYASNKSLGKLKTISKCVGPLEDVKKILFSKLNIDKRNIIIEKGWFQHTLPKYKKDIGPIAILRLDGDWYESTKVCIENLYDNVISGGYIIIDDYGCWIGCKKAIDEFLQKNKIKVKFNIIDQTGVYFQKP